MPNEENDDWPPRSTKNNRRLPDNFYGPDDRPNVVTVFSFLGYNVRNINDLNQLRDLIRYVELAKEKEERTKARRFGWIVSMCIALIGAIVTAIGQWVANHVK